MDGTLTAILLAMITYEHPPRAGFARKLRTWEGTPVADVAEKAKKAWRAVARVFKKKNKGEGESTRTS